MSNITEASDFIKRQAKIYEGFVAAASMLDRIGSVEQAAQEAQRAREVAEAAKGKAELELLALQKQIDEAKDAAAQILVDADEAAKQHSMTLVSAANKRAESIVAQAEASAHQIADDINTRRMAGLNDIESFQVQAGELKTQVEAAKSEVAALQKDHDKLAKAIETLKSKFA